MSQAAPRGLFFNPWSKIKTALALAAGRAGPEVYAQGLEKWRELILFLVLTGLIGVGAVAVAWNAAFWLVLEAPRIVLLNIGSFLCLLTLALIRPLSFKARTWATLAILYAGGIILLVQVGPSGSGRELFLLASILAAGLIGLRAAAVVVAVTTATYLGLAWLLADGGQILQGLPPVYFQVWLRGGLTFLVINAVSALSLGMLVRILGLGLTKEQALGRELNWERERWAWLLDRLPALVCLQGPDYKIRFSNRAYRQRFIKHPSERCYEAVYGRTEPCRPCHANLLFEGRKEMALRDVADADGRIYQVAEHLFPDLDGSPQALVLGLDVTETRQAQRQLAESEKRYRALFDASNDLIISHDLEGRILAFNPAASRTLGYALEEVVGRPLTDFLAPGERERFHHQYLPEILEQGRSDGIAVYVDRAGAPHYVEYRHALLRPPDQPPYVSGMARDVTERLQAEQGLREMEEQLAQAQKMEAVGTLASGIAHDFNNILQAISGYTQLLQAKARPETEAHLAQIDRAVDRAGELIRRLLTFSRRSKREQRLVEFHQEITQAVELLRRTIPKMIAIDLRLAATRATLQGDPTLLEQVLMNLGTNARDAMPDGGLLSLHTANVTVRHEDGTPAGLKPGEYLLLTVSDTGHGMDKETQERIFEPFFTTKPMGHGTGLGLSTVYGIVQDHEGQIFCYSQVGQGTTFQIYLPLPVEDSPQAGIEQPHEARPSGGSETILVVDDEPAILEVAREILANHGYRVLTAASGEEALGRQEAEGGGVNLVILDLGMPGMGGQRCLEELQVRQPAVKVLVASGYLAGGPGREEDLPGAAAYIAKPYRLTDLLLKVRFVLDGPPPGGEADRRDDGDIFYFK